MSVSEQEARESLAAVEDVMARCRRSLAAAGAPYLIIWGAIWILGFLSLQVLGGLGGWIFTGLDVVGVVASVAIGVAQGRRGAVRSPADRRMCWRIGWFWIAIFAYIYLWLALVGRWDGATLSAFFGTAVMFGYVVLGLWLDALYITWAGVAVTVLTMIGYYLVGEWFMLWMAVFGGGTLLGTGLYIRKYWR